MALPYILKEVETKLDSYTSKAEKLKYLVNHLFKLKKEKSELDLLDIEKLNRLGDKTKEDYNKYMNFIDNGGVTYFNSKYNAQTGRYDIHKFDLMFAEKHDIKDLNLLLQYLSLKFKINDLQVRIGLYESLIEREKALPPQQTETKTEQETPTFTNNFDNIKPIEIYKHFKAGLVEKGYLTEKELNLYLKAAFELKTIPETLFKLKHTPTKQKIYTVFYVYYKDVSQKKHERQKEYAALLGDYFEGYKTEIIQTNWAREYKTKR